jgi:hypothetical protein
MDANGRKILRMLFSKSFVLLASLSTQSLNQFAANLADADALTAEIANVYREMQANLVSPAASTLRAEVTKQEKQAQQKRRSIPLSVCEP